MSLLEYFSVESVYAFTFILTLLLLCVHLAFVLSGRMMDNRIKLGTFICTLMIGVLATAEFIGGYLDVTDGSFRALHAAVKYFELSLTPVLPIVLGISINPHHSLRWTLLPLSFSFALEAALLPFKLVFYIDGPDVYHHGPLYWIYPAMILVGAAVLIIEFYGQARRLQNKQSFYIFLTVMIPLVCFAAHIFNPEIRMSWLGVGIALIFMYCAHCNIQLCTDHITRLLDRASFDNDLRKMKKGDSLIFFDINKFKKLDDDHGHAVGDEYLATIAKLIRNVYDDVGRCYRIGGDEFAVIIFKRNTDVKKVNEAFISVLDKARKADPLLPRISIGTSTYTGKESKADVFNTADMKMYSNKADGSNGVD